MSFSEDNLYILGRHSTLEVWCCVFFLQIALSGLRQVVAARKSFGGHSTFLHTLHFTLYTSHSTLDTPHTTLYTVHYTPHDTDTLHFALHTLHFTLHTLHFELSTLHSTLCTPHFALCTSHFAFDTTHSTLYMLHSTLHFTSLPSTRWAAATGCNIYEGFLFICFDICTINIGVSIWVRRLHLVSDLGACWLLAAMFHESCCYSKLWKSMHFNEMCVLGGG